MRLSSCASTRRTTGGDSESGPVGSADDREDFIPAPGAIGNVAPTAGRRIHPAPHPFHRCRRNGNRLNANEIRWMRSRPRSERMAVAANTQGSEMRAISRRLGRLEGRLGLVETEETRRVREFAETLRRRIADGRARVGTSERAVEDLSGLTVEEILQRGRQRARQAAIEAQ